MNETTITATVVALALGIVAKIVWDWLKNGRNGKQQSESCALADKKSATLFKMLNGIEADMGQLKEGHARTDDGGSSVVVFPPHAPSNK